MIYIGKGASKACGPCSDICEQPLGMVNLCNVITMFFVAVFAGLDYEHCELWHPWVAIPAVLFFHICFWFYLAARIKVTFESKLEEQTGVAMLKKNTTQFVLDVVWKIMVYDVGFCCYVFYFVAASIFVVFYALDLSEGCKYVPVYLWIVSMWHGAIIGICVFVWFAAVFESMCGGDCCAQMIVGPEMMKKAAEKRKPTNIVKGMFGIGGGGGAPPQQQQMQRQQQQQQYHQQPYQQQQPMYQQHQPQPQAPPQYYNQQPIPAQAQPVQRAPQAQQRAPQTQQPRTQSNVEERPNPKPEDPSVGQRVTGAIGGGFKAIGKGLQRIGDATAGTDDTNNKAANNKTNANSPNRR